MDLSSVLGLIQTALELGLICSVTVLALYLSYTMLNVCDLSTDGCFTLGAVTGAVTAMAGHPVLAVFAALGAELASGLVVSVLQTRMGVNSLLAGIIVNTTLYSINIAIMDGASLLSLNKTQTVFSLMKVALAGTQLAGQYNLLAQARKDGREAWAWNGIRRKGRDNARTPMQWDASANAGFTAGTPWIDVNPNYRQINVRAAQADSDSILHFYRKLLALRQNSDALRSGTFRLLLPEHPQLLAYERACGEERIRVSSPTLFRHFAVWVTVWVRRF